MNLSAVDCVQVPTGRLGSMRSSHGFTEAKRDSLLGEHLVRRTPDEKDYALGDYGILYLGFHGGPAKFYLRSDLTEKKGSGGSLDLNEIEDSLAIDAAYDCSGMVIQFASCSVLRSHARVAEFRRRVGVPCVSGYTKMVDATLSWAFELMYLDELSKKNTHNPDTLKTLWHRLNNKPEYAGLTEHLGFRMNGCEMNTA